MILSMEAHFHKLGKKYEIYELKSQKRLLYLSCHRIILIYDYLT